MPLFVAPCPWSWVDGIAAMVFRVARQRITIALEEIMVIEENLNNFLCFDGI